MWPARNSQAVSLGDTETVPWDPEGILAEYPMPPVYLRDKALFHRAVTGDGLSCTSVLCCMLSKCLVLNGRKMGDFIGLHGSVRSLHFLFNLVKI